MAHDPLRELAHDHHELSGLLVAVHEALSRVERGKSKLEDELHEIRDGIEAFREALLEHFAREQEALLPFVMSRLPAYQERGDTIIAEHDRISATLTTLVKELNTVDATGELDPWRRSLSAFEQLYTEHTKSELAFLEDVASKLANDDVATAKLRELLDES